MFIPDNLYHEQDRPSTDTEVPLSEILPAESEFIVEKVPKDETQWEDFRIDYTQENGFFKGLLYVLPVGLVFWAVLIWSVIELWMNFGGGSIGSG